MTLGKDKDSEEISDAISKSRRCNQNNEDG